MRKHAIGWTAVLARVSLALLLVSPVPVAVLDSSVWWFLGPLAACSALVVVLGALLEGPRREGEAPAAVETGPPVSGRWSALNSPATRVPSHGTRALGQEYAIDVVAEPAEGARPGAGWLPLARRATRFPAFGQPLLAVADATVVHAVDHQRDHLSRTSYPGMAYLLVESALRVVGSWRFVVGNHVVLDLGDGSYALYAHVRRGSLAVRPGDRVRAGQQVAQCGNSGNSSEPHVHFQLMDSADVELANGVPFTWRGLGVPADGETFETPTPPPGSARPTGERPDGLAA